jgi:hypothetical protein
MALVRSGGIGVLIAASLAGPRLAAAGEWRDGCPAGMTPEFHRADFRMGAVPDPSTTLTQNRLSLHALHTYGADQPGGPNHYAIHAIAHAHLETPWWKTRLVVDGLLPSSWDGQEWRVVGLPAVRAGFRWNFLGELDEAALEPGKRSVAGLRKSFAIQLLTAGTGGKSLGDSELAANQLPFDYFLFSPDRSAGLAFEYRLEQVGCQAMFLHFSTAIVGAPHTERPAMSDGHAIVDYAAAVAVGLLITDNASILGQYATSVLQLETDRFSIHHRFRIGAEWSSRRVVIGGHLDFESRHQGLSVGLYVGVNHDHGY